MPILRAFPPARDGQPQRKTVTVAGKAQAAATDSVNSIFQIAAVALSMTGQTADAFAVTLHGEGIAAGIVQAAETDPFMAKVVAFCQKGGPYGAILTAALPLALQIGINHGKVDDSAVKMMPGKLYTVEGLAKKAAEDTEAAAA
jgi:hypothetical protein